VIHNTLTFGRVMHQGGPTNVLEKYQSRRPL